MHHRLLRGLALAFVALVLLQSVLGGILFWQNIGFGADQVFAYYRDKSFHGLLEVILPHTLFIGIALMATLHFLSFIPTIRESTKNNAVHLIFILFILDQGSPILISEGWMPASYVKIVSFISFEIILGWIWFLIFRHTLKELE